jgi:hypothetical protein
VTITSATGLDEYGMEVLGTPVVVKCCIFQKQQLVLGPQGDNVVSSTQIYVDGPTVVTTSSKIVLPDGTSPMVLAVSTFPDEWGVIDHKVIYS